MASSKTIVRVGLPLTGGRLVAAARERGYPVLFSANAFARVYKRGHEREGFFERFRAPDAEQLAGLDVALDSAGFVAAARYGDFRWTVEDYFDLVEAYPWTWYAAMDYCCEPEVAGDRPMRLLRLAGTAHLYGRCRREAAERGLPAPMPILQGWEPADYALCAQWLPLLAWPDLVGVGSVCRRPLHGANGLLAILQALDELLPAHVRLHLFGVKSGALEALAGHRRIASVDSMSWDAQARAQRRTGRDMAYRVEQMEGWAERQQALARGQGAGLQAALFDPAQCGRSSFDDREDLVLEALASQYAELVMGGDMEYRDAVWKARQDAGAVLAIVRREGTLQGALAAFEDLFPGLAEHVERLGGIDS